MKRIIMVLGMLFVGLQASAQTDMFPDAKPHSTYHNGNHSIYQQGNIRCENEGVNEDKCESIRVRAKSVNCIDSTIYGILKSKGLFPVCDFNMGFKGVCKCVCFKPGTEIWSQIGTTGQLGYQPIEELIESELLAKVVTLDENTSMEDFDVKYSGVTSWNKGIENKDYVVIDAGNDRPLYLTEMHPVLKPDGSVVAAKTLLPDDFMVTESGSVVAVKVTRAPSMEEVLNIETDGQTAASHIIFAEGFAVGDLKWQNELMAEEADIQSRK